jgi:hypothetical protein
MTDDLEVTGSGDLVTITGVNLITQALLTRLQTPPQGYRRWVRTADGLQELDTSYESQVYDHLSVPSTPANNIAIEDAIHKTASMEKRIEVLSTKIGDQNYFSEVPVEVTYRILSETELRSASLVLKV